MKTIIDAINEFEGEWPFPRFNSMIGSKGKQIGYQDGTIVSYGYPREEYLNEDMWYFVCTKAEFCALVSELGSLNASVTDVVDFNLTKHDFYSDIRCKGGDIKSVELCVFDYHHTIDVKLKRKDAIAIAKHFKLTVEDLK